MHTYIHGSETTTDTTNSQPNRPIEQLAHRDVRALTEYMTILSDVGMSADAAGLYTVVSKSGRSYTVDIETGACECNDSFYHHPAGGCKHLRRVEFATGRRSIPEWVDEDAIDDQLKLDESESASR
jgi:hypothetical protein